MIPVAESTTVQEMVDAGFGREESAEYVAWLDRVYKGLDPDRLPYPQDFHPPGCHCEDCEPADYGKQPYEDMPEVLKGHVEGEYDLHHLCEEQRDEVWVGDIHGVPVFC